MTINDKDNDDAMKRKIMSVLTRWPDHPKEGVTFLDVCPLVNDPSLFQIVINWMAAKVPAETTHIVSPDARGFLFAAPVALARKLPLVPARKAGKLPGPVACENYALEYGHGTLCMQETAINAGDKVYIIDDILATGGTIAALKRLITRREASFLGAACLLDIRDVPKDLVCGEVTCWLDWDGN